MTGAELLALGHAALARSHKLILLGGGLELLSIVAGLISRRIGRPCCSSSWPSACWRATTMCSPFSSTISTRPT